MCVDETILTLHGQFNTIIKINKYNLYTVLPTVFDSDYKLSFTLSIYQIDQRDWLIHIWCIKKLFRNKNMATKAGRKYFLKWKECIHHATQYLNHFPVINIKSFSEILCHLNAWHTIYSVKNTCDLLDF